MTFLIGQLKTRVVSAQKNRTIEWVVLSIYNIKLLFHESHPSRHDFKTMYHTKALNLYVSDKRA